jgi:hypothetical protein
MQWHFILNRWKWVGRLASLGRVSDKILDNSANRDRNSDGMAVTIQPCEAAKGVATLHPLLWPERHPERGCLTTTMEPDHSRLHGHIHPCRRFDHRPVSCVCRPDIGDGPRHRDRAPEVRHGDGREVELVELPVVGLTIVLGPTGAVEELGVVSCIHVVDQAGISSLVRVDVPSAEVERISQFPRSALRLDWHAESVRHGCCKLKRGAKR